MPEHQVPITPEHIRNGQHDNPRECPAALALREYRGPGPGFPNPQVGFRKTTIDHLPFAPTDQYTHTQQLTDWIRSYLHSRKSNRDPGKIPGPATLLVNPQEERIGIDRNPAKRKSRKMRKADS